MRFSKLFHSLMLLLCGEGHRRARYIKKHNLFGAMGENCYWHPWKLPGDPKMLFIHNNVKVASDVIFINHDICNQMLNQKNNTKEFKYFIEPIEVFDNVVIGSNSIILPGRKIGPNAIVGGGTVVCRNVEENTIVGGNPCRIIGNLSQFEQKRRNYKQ